jgi:uroporphyrinogen III methyltransferase/synthase
VFTSANAVDYFMQRVLANGDVRDLKGVRLCAIGPSTEQRVARYGLRVDVMPDEANSEAVMDALRASGNLKGARVLLPRADIAREVLTDQLRDAGAEVTEITAYRTMLGETERDADQDIYRMLLDRQIDAITFTSASTVKNFAKIFGEEQAADLLRTTVVASIGPVTAEAAQQLGIQTTVMPERYTIPDLVDALVEHFRGELTVQS